jgi:hypothetical protein
MSLAEEIEAVLSDELLAWHDEEDGDSGWATHTSPETIASDVMAEVRAWLVAHGADDAVAELDRESQA